jgi:hypothetical protein
MPCRKVVLSFLTNKGTSKLSSNESQRIVEETNDTVLLEIYIHTTNDIIMELLKYGRNVVVAQKFSCHYERKNC